MHSPARPAGIGALVLVALLLTAMLAFGGVQVGRYPLAERLLAWTIRVLVVSLVAGLLVLLAARGGPACGTSPWCCWARHWRPRWR